MKTIKAKVIGIFLLIFTILIANSSIAVLNFYILNNSIKNILKDNYDSIVYSQNMIASIERQDSAELAQMFEENKESAKQLFNEYEKEFLGWLLKAKGNITESGEEQVVGNIENLYSDYLLKFNDLSATQDEYGDREARTFYYNEIFPLFEKIKAGCRNLQDINQRKIIEKENDAENTSRRATYITIIISTLTILLGLFFITYLANRIIRPLRDIVTKIRKISDGNYSQQINVSGKDEVATLANEFNIMASKLKAYDDLNITKLMKEKQKVEVIVESISDGIIVTGAADRILLVNRAAEKIFNIKEEDSIKRYFFEVIKNDNLLNLIESVRKYESQPVAKDYLDLTIKRKNYVNYYRAIAKPITNIEGESIGVVTLFQDITKLKELDDLKSEFISSISHELRTPLTSIIIATEILLNESQGKINENQRELVKVVAEDSDRLKNLINDLLDLSILESGKVRFDIRKQDINDIIGYILKIFQVQLKEKNIDIEVNIEKNISKVMADFSKISQVLTNLLSNSINYGIANKKLKIKIGAKSLNSKIMIYISDNGRGITEEDQKRIFDKFARIESQNIFETQGTGLGLPISKDIIAAHGGTIWVESELGKGSTFYFTLNPARG
jgi:PAS domain S-box-containing protein